MQPSVTACLVASILVGLACLGAAYGQNPATSAPERRVEADAVLSTLRSYDRDVGEFRAPRTDAESPRIRRAPDGRVRHLAAPPGHAFDGARTVPGDPEGNARRFLEDHRDLLGMASAAAAWVPYRTQSSDGRISVRLQQMHAGIPVYGAQTTVQLNAAQGVEFVAADLAPEVDAFDHDPSRLEPAIPQHAAVATVVERVQQEADGGAFDVSPPELMIYAPSVQDRPGEPRLVWMMEAHAESAPSANARWLIDAHTGAPVRRFAFSHSALDRRVYDANNSTDWPGTLVRDEGDPASGIADADNVYAYAADTYTFYLNNHNRDSFNDAGATIDMTVRYCESATNCPTRNAVWTGTRIWIGDPYAADDIVGHEFTHAVIGQTSGLEYENAAGAINESLADLWGEFIDLTNSNGTDDMSVRWLMGEDIDTGAIRNMSDPPDGGQPDHLGSSLYVDPVDNPNDDNDYGGVHTNSGVNNKLCFLLVDGDEFNGQTVTGMGLAAVAALYYEANANLLTSQSNWTDLFEALSQAAVNLGWTAPQRNNLYRACRAVEITNLREHYVDGASGCVWQSGDMDCGFLQGPYHTASIAVDDALPGDRLFIRAGNYPESVVLDEVTILRAYDGNAVVGQ